MTRDSARKVTLGLLETNTPKEIRNRNQVGEKSYTGIMFFGPSVGKSFHFFRDDNQEMYTSTVKEIQYEGNVLTLKTLNSKYRLTIGEAI